MTWSAVVIAILASQAGVYAQDDLASGFREPPDSARPGVYWYFMDGNRTREGMTDDLESMKEAGIGNLVFLEVNVGVPRGPVDLLSDEWQELFAHAVREAERLGIEITLGSGPGWAGSGGPWVKLEQSMQHLVASSVAAKGPAEFDGDLPRPAPREPYFGYRAMSDEMRRERESFYEDVAVLAFPTPGETHLIEDVDEKALYCRAPYSSRPGVKAYLPAPADHPALPPGAAIERARVVDLTDRLQSDGRLAWDVPAGDWTIMRFGRRNTGATTRPAPRPGLGFECDKFAAAAFDAHFDAYIGTLIRKVGPRAKGTGGGWTMLHIDSWEMGAQNWTATFRDEFTRRCGYDPLPFLPAYTGRVVGSLELSERFLWDVRMTAQQLVLENHAGRLKELGRRHGFGLSIEPYDMNPTSDLDLGAVADVPMCEFWSEGFGFDTSYSCFEAASIAHTHGRPVVAAEAFTAASKEAWKLYPGAVKNQGDWAFSAGINRFVYHTFAHKPQGRRPGMTMGPYGVHWDRGQTWWPLVSAYHRYVARCQFLLRQGQTIADVCYLIPEGAPHVFRPPASALQGSGSMRDRRGYNFDGCSPSTLIAKASVEDGRVVFPGGASYRLLVLPSFDTMTPTLLGKIKELVESGATVVGPPPRKSPSLIDYPQCDEQVASLAAAVWGETRPAAAVVRREVGRGRVVWGGELSVAPSGTPAPRPIEQARWIWYAEGDPAASVEPGTRYFRRAFTLAADKRVQSARIEITTDNAFQVWVNGQMAAEGDNFHTIYTADAGALVKPGPNVLAVAADNGGDGPNPAGLIASLHVEYEDGSSLTLLTDRRWRAAREVDEGWRLPTASDAGWTAARELGPIGMSPWRLKAPVDPCPELYPDYEATAGLLAEMGLPRDFEADGPIRYTHRRSGGMDLYFVANRTAKLVEAACTFRVAGRRPELWDPLTGAIRDLAEYASRDGRTTVPMRFEPHQSFFVRFARELSGEGGEPPGESRESRAGENFPALETVGEIAGPWEVSFDPEWGGPGRVRFRQLQDWSQRSEPGVKHYSGIATYTSSFDLPQSLRPHSGPILLDLGVVHNLARVRLNGCHTGVVWCAPWRVDVTDAVRAKGNRLEIEVANLWPNRLIGDKALPPEQRVAWTTWNPYQPDSPLLPSGLLGPVTLRAAKPAAPR
ncbi:MAG TPA: glycosyl hydrolase [Thermoguttaceae bacterium]|nr:glycosyl hydrolase [Thermoguttaceae bacterium]